MYNSYQTGQNSTGRLPTQPNQIPQPPPYSQPTQQYNKPQPFYQQTKQQTPGNTGSHPFQKMNQPYEQGKSVYGNQINNNEYQNAQNSRMNQSLHSKQQPAYQKKPSLSAQWNRNDLNQYGRDQLSQVIPKSQPNNELDLRIRGFVDQVFSKYDQDGSMTLDKRQLHHVFNYVLKKLRIQIQLSQSQAEALLYQIDQNSDGSINKMELFQCIKCLVQNQKS